MLTPRKIWPGLVLAACACNAAASDKLNIQVAYLELEQEQAPVLSNILPEPEDAGLRGAELGIRDSNSTGKFLKHHYSLQAVTTEDPAEIIKAATRLQAEGIQYFVANMPAAQLKQLTETLGDNALIFNAGSSDNQLRQQLCSENLLHTIPSRAMLTDALGQWLKARKLDNWLLISGQRPEDKAYADSLKRTAKRFGQNIVAEKQWSFDTDLRRTAQKELPLFTQVGDDYDVVVVADESGDFGEYVQYNTWLPRPVAGTQGLKPVAWHRVVEQWGAAQLQSRFEKLANRWMTGHDYASWAAVRSVAEAVTQIKTTDLEPVRNYIASDKFQLAAFKGRKMNYRNWSGQLRQPIPLIQPRSLVSQSPQEGFLHPVTDLDTLGFDKPESKCRVL